MDETTRIASAIGCVKRYAGQVTWPKEAGLELDMRIAQHLMEGLSIPEVAHRMNFKPEQMRGMVLTLAGRFNTKAVRGDYWYLSPMARAFLVKMRLHTRQDFRSRYRMFLNRLDSIPGIGPVLSQEFTAWLDCDEGPDRLSIDPDEEYLRDLKKKRLAAARRLDLMRRQQTKHPQHTFLEEHIKLYDEFIASYEDLLKRYRKRRAGCISTGPGM